MQDFWVKIELLLSKIFREFIKNNCRLHIWTERNIEKVVVKKSKKEFK